MGFGSLSKVGFSIADSAVLLGDSLSIMPKIDAGSVDLILTDPPYNVSRQNNLHTMGRRGIEMSWDGFFDQTGWLSEVARLLRPGGAAIIWNDWKNLGDIARELELRGLQVKRDLVWHKSNPMPRNTKRLPVQAREYALWAIKPKSKSKGGWTFNPGAESYHRAEWTYPVQRAVNRTKKPDQLFESLVRLFSRPGDLVFDPFSGCGTTATACLGTGRRFLCIEREPKFYYDSVSRLFNNPRTGLVA